MQQLQRLDQFRDAIRAGKTRVGAGMPARPRPDPAMVAVWLNSAALPWAERPVFMTTTGTLRSPRAPRQRFEARDRMENPRRASRWRSPRASSSNASARPDTSSLCLVAGRDHIRDRQCTLLHGHADGDVRGLGDDRDAAFRRVKPPAAVLIGPQRRTVEKVDKAVAIRDR